MRALLRLALLVVESVLRGLVQQEQIVAGQATQPTRAMLQLVQSGSVWRGNGANAFASEVISLVLPDLEMVSRHITMTNGNLSRATEIMKQADAQVLKQVRNLNDRFKAIY